MVRSGTILSILLFAPPALAQSPGGQVDLALGRQVLEQSCGVCHTKPLVTSGRFGPALSRDSASGNPEAMADVIANGIPERMPGFKYHLTQNQIASVIAYMRTLDPPPPDPKPTARTSGERRDDN